MDRRLIILIAVFILGSASVFAYRKVFYKPEGIRYTIKPLNAIKSGDSISYSDQTSGASRWKWDFGDGEFSADQTGNHTYLNAGNFPVTLTVYGPFGVQRKTNNVTVLASNVSALAAGPSILGPADAKAGVPATWGSSATAASYEWKVEGEPSLAAQKSTTATYAFKNAGQHTLVLTTHNPDNVIRRSINVMAPEAPAAKPVASAAPMQAPPQQRPAPMAKPKPAHHEGQKQHGNSLEDLGDGEVIKK